jgi:hypothetical protein
MTKFFIGFQLSFWLGFILGDVTTGIEFQMAFVAGYALVRLVPGKTWLAIGRAFVEFPWFWVLFWSDL